MIFLYICHVLCSIRRLVDNKCINLHDSITYLLLLLLHILEHIYLHTLNQEKSKITMEQSFQCKSYANFYLFC